MAPIQFGTNNLESETIWGFDRESKQKLLFSLIPKGWDTWRHIYFDLRAYIIRSDPLFKGSQPRPPIISSPDKRLRSQLSLIKVRRGPNELRPQPRLPSELTPAAKVRHSEP